jgi:hypothetical protein
MISTRLPGCPTPSISSGWSRAPSSPSAREQQGLGKQVAKAEVELKRLWRKRLEIDEMLARPNSNDTPVGDLHEEPRRGRAAPCHGGLELVRIKRSGGTRRCSAGRHLST